MKDNIKIAFDSIYAEDHLKQSTRAFLQMNRHRKRKQVQRMAVSFAGFLVLLMFSANMYFSQTMYIDIDINPSIELTVNRFDRVIAVHAYNQEGEALIEGLSVRHKLYENAVRLFTESAIQNGFLLEGGLVSVTLQSETSNILPDTLKNTIATVSQGHHTRINIDVFSVDSNTRASAHGLNLTPAKYLSILALQEVDPSASIEGCRGHSIEEIRALTQEHHNQKHRRRHHGRYSEMHSKW